MRKIFCAIMLVTAFTVHAETMYVTDRLPVSLRAAFAEGSPVVKTIEGGASLDVLEHADKYVRVRDTQGAEGWIEARFLMNAPPTRPELERA